MNSGINETSDPRDEDRDPLEQLAEEFLARRRQGQEASIDEYAERHPQLAARIRDLFPTLLLMEELKPGPEPDGAAASACPLRRLGDFRILRELGRGGMGVVYEAEQESLGRHVALKVLPAVYTASAGRLKRFLREARAAARLHHTNIIPVFGVGQQDGVHYYVMQFIPGFGLDAVLGGLALTVAPSTKRIASEPTRTRNAPDDDSAIQAAQMMLNASGDQPGGDRQRPPQRPAPVAPGVYGSPHYWRAVARIGVQVADALAYAHEQGTLHRDIKPGNLLLDRHGAVWIADFGLAKLEDVEDLTHSGDLLGTLRYMAPERFAGEADARSDVYSLGLTLYELLTLRPGFDDADRGRLIRRIAEEEPPRPGKLNPAVPRDLETIVLKAIARNPDHRYRTAAALADDLRSYLEDRPVQARRATLPGRLWRWCKRNRAVAALGSAAALLLVVVAVVASIGYVRESRLRARAEDERAQTRIQRERAEANLRLATRAFEEVFARIASDTVVHPLEEEDDEEWPELAWETVLTDKDAALLESMLKFYDQFARQNQADVKLAKETARAYRRVGDIQRRLGQYAKAEAAYRHALTAYEELAEHEDPELLVAVAAIHNDLGIIDRNQFRRSDARAAHRKAEETLHKQTAAAAAQPESRFELARTYSCLGTLGPERRGGPGGGGPGTPWRGHRGPGRSQAQEPPIEYNGKALDLLRQLVAEDPANARYRLALARCLRDRSWVLAFGRRTEEAQQARAEAIALLETLAAEAPQNAQYRYELAETYIAFVPRPGEGNVGEEARRQTQQAVTLAAQLLERHPTVGQYKTLLVRASLRQGDLLRRAGDLPAAEECLAKAVAVQRPGVNGSTPPSAALGLSRTLAQLAEVQIARKELPQARATLEEAIAVAKRVQESPGQSASPPGPSSAPPRGPSPGLSPGALSGPGRGSPRMLLAMEYRSLARVLKELGESAPAAEAEAKAEELTGRRGARPGPRGPIRP